MDDDFDFPMSSDDLPDEKVADDVPDENPILEVGEEKPLGKTGIKKKLLREGEGWENPNVGDEVEGIPSYQPKCFKTFMLYEVSAFCVAFWFEFLAGIRNYVVHYSLDH